MATTPTPTVSVPAAALRTLLDAWPTVTSSVTRRAVLPEWDDAYDALKAAVDGDDGTLGLHVERDSPAGSTNNFQMFAEEWAGSVGVELEAPEPGT